VKLDHHRKETLIKVLINKDLPGAEELEDDEILSESANLSSKLNDTHTIQRGVVVKV
jgi:hypothetical protein